MVCGVHLRLPAEKDATKHVSPLSNAWGKMDGTNSCSIQYGDDTQYYHSWNAWLHGRGDDDRFFNLGHFRDNSLFIH